MNEHYYYWIGIGIRDTFKYKSNGEPVTINPIPWKGGEPSTETNCVLGYSRTLKWSADEPCSWENGYTICEYTL